MGKVRMEDCDKERVGARLRGAREARGLTQEALAEELHVSRQTVSRWERGKTLPDIQSLVGAASTLGMDLAELLGADQTRRMAELSRDSRHELRTIYGALCLGWFVVLALEVTKIFSPGQTFLLVYAALLVPTIWLGWHAHSIERDAGLRCARDVTAYVRDGVRPEDDERPLTFLGWVLKAVPAALVIEVIASLLGGH